jgi:hypothetical protein
MNPDEIERVLLWLDELRNQHQRNHNSKGPKTINELTSTFAGYRQELSARGMSTDTITSVAAAYANVAAREYSADQEQHMRELITALEHGFQVELRKTSGASGTPLHTYNRRKTSPCASSIEHHKAASIGPLAPLYGRSRRAIALSIFPKE